MQGDILNYLRAKSVTRLEDEKLSLKSHIEETLWRAQQLKEFIKKNNVQFKEFHDTFFKKLYIALFIHDLGKINYKFQKNVFLPDEREKNLNGWDKIKEFFKNFERIDIKDHEVVSIIYSILFLGNSKEDKEIRTAILLHHYNQFYTHRELNICNLLEDYPEISKLIYFILKNQSKIEKLLKELINELKEEFNSAEDIKDVLVELERRMNFDNIKNFQDSIKRRYGISKKVKFYEIDNKNPDYNFFLFLGCLRRCDYAASGDIKIEDVQNLKETVYKELNERIKERIKKEIWQERILLENDSDNLVLIAPTGSGKTEFALLWTKNRGKKLIYTLPLRVALNDLYNRFSDKGNGYFKAVNSLRILHSTSFIEYLKEESEEKLDVSEKQTSAELFSSPLILTTPDQVFLSSLKYYGFDKLVSIYPLSAIVIDEIQAYNPEMAAVLIKTLEIIKKLTGNLLIITATFPPYFEEFVSGFTIIDSEKMDSKIKNQIKNYNLQRHKIKVLNSQSIFEYKKQKNKEFELNINKQSLDEIKNVIRQNESMNILIILNNVGKAIKLYKELEKDLNGLKVEKENLYLLHSRLLEKEKRLRINEIKTKLEDVEKKNKGKLTSRERLILVATQIVEASVDIDFDILITEISPIDSQIQRWGRIYRNRNNHYLNHAPNIFVFESIDIGTSAVYDKRAIEKTIEVLKKYQNQILNYEMERKIIKEVFESKIENQTLKDIFVNEIKNNLEWLEYYSIEKREEAQRLFRYMAGIQAVVPQLMDCNGIEKEFSNVILKPDKKISWRDIINNIKNKTKETDIDEWKLKKILYDYSFNLPVYSFKDRNELTKKLKKFKGFFVLVDEKLQDDELKEEIKNYGVQKIWNVDIDEKEIEKSENII